MHVGARSRREWSDDDTGDQIAEDHRLPESLGDDATRECGEHREHQVGYKLELVHRPTLSAITAP
jgi:hypothetical protein